MNQRQVIFEYVQIGNSVKVTALDAESLVEVSVVVPAGTARGDMQQVALRKLEYMINQRPKREGGELV